MPDSSKDMEQKRVKEIHKSESKQCSAAAGLEPVTNFEISRWAKTHI